MFLGTGVMVGVGVGAAAVDIFSGRAAITSGSSSFACDSVSGTTGSSSMVDNSTINASDNLNGGVAWERNDDSSTTPLTPEYVPLSRVSSSAEIVAFLASVYYLS